MVAIFRTKLASIKVGVRWRHAVASQSKAGLEQRDVQSVIRSRTRRLSLTSVRS